MFGVLCTHRIWRSVGRAAAGGVATEAVVAAVPALPVRPALLLPRPRLAVGPGQGAPPCILPRPPASQSVKQLLTRGGRGGVALSCASLPPLQCLTRTVPLAQSEGQALTLRRLIHSLDQVESNGNGTIGPDSLHVDSHPMMVPALLLPHA